MLSKFDGSSRLESVKRRTMAKKFFIETVGCQMNVLDSELVVGSLRRLGYEIAHEMREADLILFNTCSVRQHAEDKIYSRAWPAYGAQKAASSQDRRRVGLHGAEGSGNHSAGAPHVDIICGPGQLANCRN